MGEPKSPPPRPLPAPNRLSELDSSDGLNLLPFDQVCSESAAPVLSDGGKPTRRLGSAEGSARAARGGCDERQSLGPSDTPLFARSSERGESKRDGRREPSLSGRSGRGPSRRHGLSNFPSSNPPPPPEPPNPERSFAVMIKDKTGNGVTEGNRSRTWLGNAYSDCSACEWLCFPVRQGMSCKKSLDVPNQILPKRP